MHLCEGAPMKHMTDKHNETLTRQNLVTNTRIIKQCSEPHRLQIYEALYIQEIRPLLNLQMTGTHKTLSLYNDLPRINPPSRPPPPPQVTPNQSEHGQMTPHETDLLELRPIRRSGRLSGLVSID